jgi:DNA-binding XRE family transcriptional regulator
VGRERLREWLEQETNDDASHNQTWLADQLGISSQHVNQILSGVRRPSLPLARDIEQLTRIPASEFAGVA